MGVFVVELANETPHFWGPKVWFGTLTEPYGFRQSGTLTGADQGPSVKASKADNTAPGIPLSILIKCSPDLFRSARSHRPSMKQSQNASWDTEREDETAPP